MPDSNAEATRQMDALLARIVDAYAAREKDPYALGAVVKELFEARELLKALNYPSGEEVLRIRLGNLDQAVMVAAGEIASWCAQAAAAKYLWENLVLLNELFNLRAAEIPDGGDPADVRIPGTRKRFADCGTDELRAAVEKARQVKPVPHPHPAPVPTPAPSDGGAPATEPDARRLWWAAGLIAFGLAFGTNVVGEILGGAGALIVANEVRKVGILAAIAWGSGLVQRVRSGDFPKVKVGIGLAMVIGFGIAVRTVRLKNPFAGVSGALQEASKAVSPVRPEPAPVPAAPAPAAVAPEFAHPSTALGGNGATPAPVAPSAPPVVAAPEPAGVPPSTEPVPSRAEGLGVNGTPAGTQIAHPSTALGVNGAGHGAHAAKHAAKAATTTVPASASAPAPAPAAAAPPSPPPAPVAATPPPAPVAPPEDKDLYHLLHLNRLGDPPAKSLKEEQREYHRKDPKAFPYDPDAPTPPAPPPPPPKAPQQIWHERAEEIRANPKLIKEPSLLPGTEVWENYPDGGRARVR